MTTHTHKEMSKICWLRLLSINASQTKLQLGDLKRQQLFMITSRSSGDSVSSARQFSQRDNQTVVGWESFQSLLPHMSGVLEAGCWPELTV